MKRRTWSTLRGRIATKYRVDESGCWIWTGMINPTTGYGRISDGGKVKTAHRVMYELSVGPIPEGLVMDHLCHVRACVNPEHLRVVTKRQNCLENNTNYYAKNAQKTHCLRGHELNGANTYKYNKTIGRKCRICQSIRSKEYFARKKARLAVKGVSDAR